MGEDKLKNDLYRELGLDEIDFDGLETALREIRNHELKKESGEKQLSRKSAKQTSAGETAKSPRQEVKVRKRQRKASRPASAGVRVALALVKAVTVAACIALTVALLGGIALLSAGGTASSGGSFNVAIMDRFDMFMTNEISNALDGFVDVEKVYWLNDSDVVAPKPNPANYGTAATPGELKWLFEEAAGLIGDQKLIFNEQTPVWEGDSIYYYYDETILVITWKQAIDRVMYTFSEVRIAHPSQLRRFLAGGEFGSDKQYTTTEMASSVNAVVASSGDFYKHRLNGVIVYDRQVRRFAGKHVDTCYINDDGDLLFTYRKQLASKEEAEQFVQDNNVRFSLAFGPVLVDKGVACPHDTYTLGEIDGFYSRAAMCQVGQLHYLMASAGGEGEYKNRHTIKEMAKTLEELGVEKAYALDGGQTTVIAMDGQLINNVEYGYQRQISDIIYFATALPEGE